MATFFSPFSHSVHPQSLYQSLNIISRQGYQYSPVVFSAVVVRNVANVIGFSLPIYARFDPQRANDLYVSDLASKFVAVFSMMQMTNPPPRLIINSIHCNSAAGLAMDRQQNL